MHIVPDAGTENDTAALFNFSADAGTGKQFSGGTVPLYKV